MVDCWLVGCDWRRLGWRWLMGVVVELLLGVGGVAGGLVGPWCGMGECHTSQ